MQIRFGIKTLLVGIGLAASLMWAITQLGMAQAQMTIVDNNLTVDSLGCVSGKIEWEYEGPGSAKRHSYVCLIHNIQQPELAELKTGESIRFKFRKYAYGPLTPQDPHRVFITRVLKIPNRYISGYAMMEGWTDIIVRGE